MVTATVYKESKETMAGIAMKKIDGIMTVTKIRDDGLFVNTDIKEGQRVVLVNEVPVDSSMETKQLMDIIRNVGPGEITIVTATNEVTTVVHKPFEDSKCGIVVVKQGGKIVVSKFVDGGLFSLPASQGGGIRVGQQVLSINDTPITSNMTAKDVVSMLKGAPGGDLKVVTSMSAVGDTGGGGGGPVKVKFLYTATDVSINRALPSTLKSHYNDDSTMAEWIGFCDRVDGVLRVTVGSKSSSANDNGTKAMGTICIILGIVVLIFFSLIIGIIMAVGGCMCCGNSASGGPVTVDATTQCRIQLTATCEQMTNMSTTKAKGLVYSLGTINVSEVPATATPKEKALLACIHVATAEGTTTATANAIPVVEPLSVGAESGKSHPMAFAESVEEV